MNEESSENEGNSLENTNDNPESRSHEEEEVQQRGRAGQLFELQEGEQHHEQLRLDEILSNYNHQGTDFGLHVQEEGKPYNVVTNQQKDKETMVLSLNLYKVATGGSRPGMNPALSKPSFCPTHNDNFVCGTEEQDQYRRTQNVMIFSSIEGNSVNVRFTYPVTDYVRDLQWIDTQHIVFAINQKLGLVRMTQDLTVDAIVMFPEFHKDAIRELCVSEGNKNLVISGGFDGNVFVTDISRLCSDIEKNEKKSENSLYPCRDVVGSVHWHPEDTFLASCTTDTGTLHIFDIRTDKRRPAIVYDTGKKELYSHSYKDGNTMLLGFGDGYIHVFDTRNKRTVMTFHDPNQKQIGEIRFDYETKMFATFGHPAVTLWGFNENSMVINAHHILPEYTMFPMYKTSGEFRRGTRTYGVTDSTGLFSLYEYSQ